MKKFFEIFQHFFETDYSSLRMSSESHFQTLEADLLPQEDLRIHVDLNRLADDQLMILFLLHFGKAYERWEDSFDYDYVINELAICKAICEHVKTKNISLENQIIFEILLALTCQVKSAVFVENSMIANEPESFKKYSFETAQHARKIVSHASKIISKPHGYPEILRLFAKNLTFHFSPVINQYSLLGEIGNINALICQDQNEFKRIFHKIYPPALKVVDELANQKNFEAASELRAHLINLNSHLNSPLEENLFLEGITGESSFGFYIDWPLETTGFKTQEERFDWLIEKLPNALNGQFSFLNIEHITKDPLPDILESSSSQDVFDNLVLDLESIEIKSFDTANSTKSNSFILNPKIYHYGIGIGKVTFEFNIDELRIDEFYALKHMFSRHSAQFIISKVEQNKVKDIGYYRLIDVATQLIKDYTSILESICSELNQKPYQLICWNDVDNAWFVNLSVYAIKNQLGVLQDYNSLNQHYQFAALICYPRADRSSLNDWISLNPDKMKLNNLGHIRGHKGDLYIISENHSICYLPENPRFIVNQYAETSNWVFIIRTLLVYSMSQSQIIQKKLSSDISLLKSNGAMNSSLFDEHYNSLIERRTLIQSHRTLSMSIIEHATSMEVAQYADHGLLLNRVFKEIRLLDMIQRLQDRIEGLATAQEGINVVMEDLRAEQQKKSRERLDLLLFILTLIQVFDTVQLIHEIATGEEISLSGLLSISAASLIVVFLLIMTYHPVIERIKKVK